MFRRLHMLAMLIVGLTFFLSAGTALADVFASQIKITNPDDSPFDGNFSDGSGAKISFFLNDTANVVNIVIKDAQSGTAIMEVDMGPLGSGQYSMDWDGSGGESGVQYVVEITAEQTNRSNDEWTMFFDSGDIDIFSRGVGVVRDMTSPLFGLMYAPNTGGNAPQEGSGITIYNPDGSFHDPFLVAKHVRDGGDIDWGVGTDIMFSSEFDTQERFYVSTITMGEVRRLNLDYTVTSVITGLTNPKGLYVAGEGDNLTIYVADDNKILRGTIGTADLMLASSMEIVAEFATLYPHQLILDDEGYMYVTLRQFNELGSEGRGIRKYDISGNLPLGEDDAFWFLGEEKTFISNDLLLDHGSDPNSASDDILYYCTRAGGGFDQDGIWRVDDINSIFPDTVRIITEDDFYGSTLGSDANIQARASIDFDAAGNIIFFENSNEHIFFISPPGEGTTNSFTTTGPDTIMITTAVGVENTAEAGPLDSYQLFQNYPNPFNPETVIKFSLRTPEVVSLRIFNLKGQLVRTIVDSEQRSAGVYQISWDGTNNSGDQVSSGRYVYTLTMGTMSRSRVMVLSR